jgi:diguanylate cyclase (GGDEF)-like protein
VTAPGPAPTGRHAAPTRTERFLLPGYGDLSVLARTGVVLVSAGVIFCLGVGDILTGPDVNFTLLYLAPIAFGAWLASARWGLALSALAAVVSAAADVDSRLGVRLPASVLAWNLVVQFGVFVALVLLLTGLRGRLELEQQMARTDPLTGLANRRAFAEAASIELERSRRWRRAVSFAYLDCDDFKTINDRLGHQQGDALLVAVAETLRGTTRVADLVARLGGDEFGLLLPETESATAQQLLGRLRAALLARMKEGRWEVGFSIGVATFLEMPPSIDDLLARADALMYEAKRTRRGSIRAASYLASGGATTPVQET